MAAQEPCGRMDLQGGNGKMFWPLWYLASRIEQDGPHGYLYHAHHPNA